MNSKRKTSWIGLILIISFALLSACNMPGRNTPTPSGFELIGTSAAMTVVAQLTEISRPPVTPVGPTLEVTPTTTQGTPGIPPGPSPLPPTQTFVPPQPTLPPAGDCDRAKFIADVTIPDNSVLAPGASFVKTWRLQNVGECDWGAGYALVFTKGERLGAPEFVNLPSTVAAGERIEISIPMQAPTTPGTYRSEWMLRNAANQVFGTAKSAQEPIWAQIKVRGVGSGGIAFDFISSASSANWYSGAADSAGLPLTFGGSLDDVNGVARIIEGVPLEVGSTSGKILLTVPRSEIDGYVYGIYPPYQVQDGDRLKTRVGFAANPDGKCGLGKVIFEIAAKDGDDIDTLVRVPAACDGAFNQIDLDLSSLKGRTLQFILAVRADGSPQDDWAIWSSPLIAR